MACMPCRANPPASRSLCAAPAAAAASIAASSAAGLLPAAASLSSLRAAGLASRAQSMCEACSRSCSPCRSTMDCDSRLRLRASASWAWSASLNCSSFFAVGTAAVHAECPLASNSPSVAGRSCAGCSVILKLCCSEMSLKLWWLLLPARDAWLSGTSAASGPPAGAATDGRGHGSGEPAPPGGVPTGTGPGVAPAMLAPTGSPGAPGAPWGTPTEAPGQAVRQTLWPQSAAEKSKVPSGAGPRLVKLPS
mmetsp:Transcript_103311/g.328554  ORF Transcript_103311/g.328554 Transcript_103311/m.328554 type:complete len:250 (+) Transcript_103311:522-1271(+)